MKRSHQKHNVWQTSVMWSHAKVHEAWRYLCTPANVVHSDPPAFCAHEAYSIYKTVPMSSAAAPVRQEVFAEERIANLSSTEVNIWARLHMCETLPAEICPYTNCVAVR